MARIGYLSKVTLAEVAQLVERGPEKAGVGGSTPSLGIFYSALCMFSDRSDSPRTSPQIQSIENIGFRKVAKYESKAAHGILHARPAVKSSFY